MADALEGALRDMLEDEKLTAADRIKLLEIGAKILLARHKTEGSADNEDFFP